MAMTARSSNKSTDQKEINENKVTENRSETSENSENISETKNAKIAHLKYKNCQFN